MTGKNIRNPSGAYNTLRMSDETTSLAKGRLLRGDRMCEHLQNYGKLYDYCVAPKAGRQQTCTHVRK